jgi:hypothetical protein
MSASIDFRVTHDWKCRLRQFGMLCKQMKCGKNYLNDEGRTAAVDEISAVGIEEFWGTAGRSHQKYCTV